MSRDHNIRPSESSHDLKLVDSKYHTGRAWLVTVYKGIFPLEDWKRGSFSAHRNPATQIYLTVAERLSVTFVHVARFIKSGTRYIPT